MRLAMMLQPALQSQRKCHALASSSLNTNNLSSDPSVPPADGANLFSGLPNEVLHQIIMKSDLIARHSFRLCSKQLRLLQVEPGYAPPPLSQAEYIRFQRQLETHSSHKLRNLYCPSCNTFKKPTPSRTTFADVHAVQNYSRQRICVECGIANGYYNRRDVVIKKMKYFLCGGCKLLLPHEKEENNVANAVFTKAFPYHDDGWSRAAEITIDSGKKKWCKQCRAVIANLGDSGAVKVKLVRGNS